MKYLKRIFRLSFLGGLMACVGCASTMRQTYIGENGKSVTVEIVDGSFGAKNIAKSHALYTLTKDGAVTMQFDGDRKTDRSAEAQLGQAIINGAAASLATFLTTGNPPAAAAAGVGTGAATALMPTVSDLLED